MEASSGSLSGSATSMTDGNASDGSYVQFGSSTSSVMFLNNENYADAVSDAANYQVMILQYNGSSGESTYSPTFVAALRAANPNIKVFVYMDPLYARPTDASGWGVCVPWTKSGSSPSAYPGGNDTSWFLKDSSGDPIVASDGSDYLLDEGNTNYQQFCLSHAISFAKAGGFDGVYWDDMNAALYHVPNGVTIPSYPTAASWVTAENSFLQYAETQLHSQGLLSVGNVADSYGSSGGRVWREFGLYMDGNENEAWMTSSLSSENQSSYWLTQLSDDLWSEQNDKLAIMHSYSGTEVGNTYGLASMLLVASGESSYSTANSSSIGQCYYSGCEANYSEYTTAQQLGPPSSSASPTITKSSTGAGASVYSRKFANGLVIVNPTSSTISGQDLGGTYAGSCGSGTLTDVTTVDLAANTGCIFISSQN